MDEEKSQPRTQDMVLKRENEKARQGSDMIPYNKGLVSNAQELRKNMTPEEKHLWYDFLKRLPLTVHRQHNMEGYIVDFYIAEKKIVVEVDGRQHLLPEHKAADEKRDACLASWGFSVLRYSNDSVRNYFTAVAQDILQKLNLSFTDLKPLKNTSSVTLRVPPSPTGEG